jgi:hypothetical protein
MVSALRTAPPLEWKPRCLSGWTGADNFNGVHMLAISALQRYGIAVRRGTPFGLGRIGPPRGPPFHSDRLFCSCLDFCSR